MPRRVRRNVSEQILAPNSFWNRDAAPTGRFAPLRGQHHAQVAIIGGGITGLSTALELLQRGYRVTVCESSVIGAGTTAGSTGHLDAHLERGHRKLVDEIGAEDARQMVAYRMRAIDAIEQRCDDSCDFVRLPGYQYSEDAGDRDELQEDCETAAQLGLPARWSDSVPIPEAVCGYRVDRMARFHCGRYLQRLAQLVVDAGGEIFEHTLVEPPTGSHPGQLATDAGQLHFEHVVVAVHSGYTDSLRVFALIPPYQSYVLAARLASPPPDALFWDNASPYHYTRRASSQAKDVYLIGGCDHHTGAGDELRAQADLEEYARSRFDVREIICRWSAEFFEPVDGIPVIGRDAGKENVWVATGFSGVGLTWGTAAGRVIAEQIVGIHTPLDERLSPARFGARKFAKMATEHASAVSSYAERVLPAEKIDPATIGPGEGRVGEVDGKHTAICRTRDGLEHRCSPICVHMGGVVRWNPAEQTWDCPVHGGRYDATGCRLYGPPSSGLGTP